VGKPNLCWEKEDNPTISLVFGIGISSPLASRHQSTSHSGGKGFWTSFQISLSSRVDFWNIFGLEAAMERGERTLSGDLPNHKK
jgi:hypothetical protein